jgi:hypothetical protein
MEEAKHQLQGWIKTSYCSCEAEFYKITKIEWLRIPMTGWQEKD